MGIPSDLLKQPAHRVVQKARSVPAYGHVRVSEKQGRKLPTNSAAQRAGTRYEKRVEEYLRRVQPYYACDLHSNVWFDVGNRSAQTDFFLTFPSKAAILFEVKQTWVDTTNQLAFYRYLLEESGLGPVTCCTICMNLTPETPTDKIIHSFDDIEEGAVWLLRL